MREIFYLIQKDFRLEWRQSHNFNSMVLYVVSTVFIAYMSFRLKNQQVEPATWNTLFWIILLFTAVNSITRSFAQERTHRFLYYYQLVKPQHVIISKIIFNTGLMLLVGFLGLLMYSFFMGNPVIDMPAYISAVALGAVGFSSSLTLLSSIVSHAQNAAGLMAVLSFPIILPMLNMLIKFSNKAMNNQIGAVLSNEIMIILGIDLIVIALSYLLFPLLWKN